MNSSNICFDLNTYLLNFVFNKSHSLSLFQNKEDNTKTEYIKINGNNVAKYINEFWTSKQRMANSLHEVSYRACFKSQLPRFFIQLLTGKSDIVYDPFSGRGTTVIEAALLGRNIIANDVNPLSTIISKPRILIPTFAQIEKRIQQINFKEDLKADIDLSMFFHPKTESEIVSLKGYLENRKKKCQEDNIDLWIRMIATNRLTGHSKNFFSVYTLPPNQAVSQERQKKINLKLNQKPQHKNVKKIILIKSADLLKDLDSKKVAFMHNIGRRSLFLNHDARNTPEIKNSTVSLTVTSPPFLDVVRYDQDNWLRCWFNNIDAKNIAKKITMSKNVHQWSLVMADVFKELYRITKDEGWVAFEVGEIRNKKIKLEEIVLPLGMRAGFKAQGVMINEQAFTKTSNIWGVENNKRGTNSNRIVIFQKCS